MGKAELDRAKLEAKMAIALKMLGENLPLETIARITELTIEQVQQLQSNKLDRQ